jgi:hypothetical protein
LRTPGFAKGSPSGRRQAAFGISLARPVAEIGRDREKSAIRSKTDLRTNELVIDPRKI